jgi:hypothetical protein
MRAHGVLHDPGLLIRIVQSNPESDAVVALRNELSTDVRTVLMECNLVVFIHSFAHVGCNGSISFLYARSTRSIAS